MRLSILKETSPNGAVRMCGIQDTFIEALIKRDPFYWVIPGEPQGSLLCMADAPISSERMTVRDDEIESVEPSTLRCPIDIPPDSI